jgi:pyruvate formate lyase activating enzyme
VVRFKEAMFFEKTNGHIIHCFLCRQHCRINDGNRGLCGVRENIKGKLYSLVYGKPVAEAVDPIEKKPLFHFLPGSHSYSIATVGCNFSCFNCQNYDIAHYPKPKKSIISNEVSPKEIIEKAKMLKCQSIAYTYTEPTIFFEYAYDIAKIANKEGIKNIFVTNGYMTEDALKTIEPFLDAANIDLKSFSDSFYQKICGAQLEPVLDSIRLHKEFNIWIELTTLLIPSLNDSEKDLKQIAEFIKELDEGIPWHISRFHPTYKLTNLPPTSIETLKKAHKIGSDIGLKHIYLGNVPGEEENTYCHNCGNLLIKRYSYKIIENNLRDSECPYCNSRIDGVWKTQN